MDWSLNCSHWLWLIILRWNLSLHFPSTDRTLKSGTGQQSYIDRQIDTRKYQYSHFFTYRFHFQEILFLHWNSAFEFHKGYSMAWFQLVESIKLEENQHFFSIQAYIAWNPRSCKRLDQVSQLVSRSLALPLLLGNRLEFRFQINLLRYKWYFLVM